MGVIRLTTNRPGQRHYPCTGAAHDWKKRERSWVTRAPWTAEHSIEPELARALIRAQCPSVPDAPLELAGQGWDVDVYRVGEHAFRFPRRKLGVMTIENELRVMPRLAPLLGVTVPVPSHVGHPSAEFAAPFYGHRWLQGITADRARLEARERAALARPLGEFLRGLHALDVEALGVEPDTLRRDMRTVAERSERQLERLFERGPSEPLAEELRAAQQLLNRPPPNRDPAAPDALIHGDFYARHLLLDAENALSGVLDWGDVCAGDRAVDLGIVYTFLPAPERAAFWTAYGEVDDETRDRARHIGLCRHAISLLAYARDIGDQLLVHEASFALGAALS
jgi:aminoglycoside phosphotransferase (APT) family kinase protein